jgi:hypothetical protein
MAPQIGQLFSKQTQVGVRGGFAGPRPAAPGGDGGAAASALERNAAAPGHAARATAAQAVELLNQALAGGANGASSGGGGRVRRAPTSGLSYYGSSPPARSPVRSRSSSTTSRSPFSACWTLTSSAVGTELPARANGRGPRACSRGQAAADAAQHASVPPLARRLTHPPGRETPSVACIVQPGSSGFQKLFFGSEEIAIPVYPRWA